MAELASQLQIEPELQGPVPRPLRFRTRTQVVRALILAFLFSLIALLWLVLAIAQGEQRELAREGHTVEARVTGKSDHYLDYKFTLNGETRTGSEQVDKETYARAAVGAPLTITYLPNRPGVQRVGTLDPAQVARAGRAATWVIGVLSLFLGGLAGYVERHFRRQLALLQRGTPVSARVLECVPPPPGTRYSAYNITCEYEAPGGTIRRTLPLNNKIAQQLAEGSTVTVLYNPRNPWESNLYLAFDPQAERLGRS